MPKTIIQFTEDEFKTVVEYYRTGEMHPNADLEERMRLLVNATEELLEVWRS